MLAVAESLCIDSCTVSPAAIALLPASKLEVKSYVVIDEAVQPAPDCVPKVPDGVPDVDCDEVLSSNLHVRVLPLKSLFALKNTFNNFPATGAKIGKFLLVALVDSPSASCKPTYVLVVSISALNI